MNSLLPTITQAQLNLLATLGALLAPLLAFTIYYHRRYTRRKRIAAALIQEIRQNRHWAYGQQPHYDQHGIVGLSETFQFLSPELNEDGGIDISKSMMPTHIVVPNYEAGDIPPSARASSKVYESTASEISRFNEDLAEDLVTYYHHLDFVKELNDIVHEGRELPPAGYSMLSDDMDMYVIENEYLVRELEIEMRRFPQTYRYAVATKEQFSNAVEGVSTRLSEVTES